MGKCHLKIRYHKRGLCLKNDCVTNMTVLCHEYKGGCILTIVLGGGGIYLHLPCLRLIWGQGIVQPQQCYDLTCEDDSS